MSITHLKKQTKKLLHFLPAHISAHPTVGSLAAYQELIARVSSFPNFHAASTNVAARPTKTQRLSMSILEDWQDVLRQGVSDLKQRVASSHRNAGARGF